MRENDENVFEDEEQECRDSTEVLLKEYDNKSRQKIEDITAMQTLLCLLAGASLIAAHLLYPEIFISVFARLRRLISDENEIMPNIIDYAEKLWK